MAQGQALRQKVGKSEGKGGVSDGPGVEGGSDSGEAEVLTIDANDVDV